MRPKEASDSAFAVHGPFREAAMAEERRALVVLAFAPGHGEVGVAGDQAVLGEAGAMGLLVLDDPEERAAEVVPAFDGIRILRRHQPDGAFAFEFLVAFDERADGLLQLGVEGLAGAAGVHLGQRAVERGDPRCVFATGRDVRREVAGDERHAERRILAGGAFEVEEGAVFGVAVSLGALAGLLGGLAEFGAVLQDAVPA
ncbi:MAG: hypothetical protein EBR95_09625, partial [Verrucomicrobia bacterium]|nr:hypothetical protein [Verrucomicrobiota bacterium]